MNELLDYFKNLENIEDKELQLTLRTLYQKSGATIPEDTVWYWSNPDNTKICLQESDISSLVPLEFFTQVSTLVLFGNRISDLTPLSKLENLRHLNLIDNNIKFLDNLVNLKLEELYLGENLISDITPLAQMSSIKMLGLRENQITNLKPLEYMTNLVQLNLSGNPIEPNKVMNLQGKLPGCKIIF